MLVNKKIEEASTIDSSFYTSRSVFFDAKKIFENTWQFVSFESFLDKKNALPFSFLDEYINEPLLLIKDKEKQLNCLSNVCTHRGNILVEKHSEIRDSLICRYHGRRFDKKGHCIFMPKFENVKGFPCDSDNLRKIPFSKWRQFIFCSLGNQYKLNNFFSDMEKRIGWMPIEDFVFNPDLSKDYFVKANWALYCDNYLEGFHIPFVHHDLAKQFKYDEYSVELFPYSNLQLGIGKKGEDCFNLPKFSKDYGKNIIAYYFWVFPNMMFNFYPWGLSLNIVKPIEEEVLEYKQLLSQGLVVPTEMEIFICNVDGSELKQITNLGKANWAPFFHPSDEKIIFCSNHKSKRGFPFNLYMIDINGENLKQITFDKQFDSFPMFSNDGKRIVFSSNRNNNGTRNTNLFIADWIE